MPADVDSPPSVLVPDSYDVLSPREENASRALKSAIVGLFILPLQVYTAWLLCRIAVSSDDTLRPPYFRYAAVAALIMILDVLVSGSLLVVLLYAPETFDGPLPPP
jgi:hypothetical protein